MKERMARSQLQLPKPVQDNQLFSRKDAQVASQAFIPGDRGEITDWMISHRQHTSFGR